MKYPISGYIFQRRDTVFIPGFTESFKKTIQDLRANKDREMEEEQQLEHQLERAEHAMIHGQFSFDKKKK